MKELLRENYNLNNSIEIIDNNNYCSFFFNDKKYYFVPYFRSEDELNDILAINEELFLRKIPTMRIIQNKNGVYIVNFNEKKYILLESNLDISNEYNVLDMIAFSEQLIVSKKQSLLYRNLWGELWSAKVDYFEYQVGQLGKDKHVILNSFSYYVGLAENAISYVNNTLKNHQQSAYENITLQRKRIGFPNIQLNYFNPLNYVIDVEVRDIASYFKSLFFCSETDLWIEVNSYLKRKRLSVYGYQLLYARLLYPSYYFDVYEKVMDGVLKEDELLKIINKSSSYELFLKKMFIEISKYATIEPINWIVNKKEL